MGNISIFLCLSKSMLLASVTQNLSSDSSLVYFQDSIPNLFPRAGVWILFATTWLLQQSPSDKIQFSQSQQADFHFLVVRKIQISGQTSTLSH